MAQGIAVGATSIALLTGGIALGRSPSHASAAIAANPPVVGYAGIELTLDDSATIIGEAGEPSRIDPIESSGIALGAQL